MLSGAAYLGKVAPNLKTLATARHAAYDIFEIIDQVKNTLILIILSRNTA